jgi:hypothetical protein
MAVLATRSDMGVPENEKRADGPVAMLRRASGLDPDAPVLQGIYAPWAESATPTVAPVVGQFEITKFAQV